MRALLVLVASTRIAAAQSAEVKAEPTPWRFDRSIGAPGWLRLGVEQQSRFEYVLRDFRAMADGDASGLSMRTLLVAEATGDHVFGGFELQDSRIYASDSVALNTTLVDPIEILQAYVGTRRNDLISDGDAFEIRAGRMTIDLSTRRIVARNRFRNTINGFTGVDATWTSKTKHAARAFVVVPVNRRPSDAEALRRNDIDLDDESTDALLWCGHYRSPTFGPSSRIELYAVGFHERDGDVASRNRQLLTLGARWVRPPKRGEVDFDTELVPQLGTSRATTAADDVTQLRHRSLTSHAELGISPAMPWKPHFTLLHDYASGDRSPSDGRTQRFDPLFGARRFDFGPTGIYGPFNRSNIQSPGTRISITPSRTFDISVGYRLYWLASRTDTWVPANVRDNMGGSGSFVGEQAEVQVRWSPFPSNLALEAGAAYLRRGQFAKSAPETRAANPVYGYTQLVLNL